MRDKIVYDAVVAAIKAKNASRAILKMIGRGLPEVPDTLIKPLAFACKALVHDNPIIDALIAAGADVDEISTCCSRPECLGRMTPLSAAAAGGNYALVVKLLQTGANAEPVTASNGFQINPLCFADCPDVVDILLDHGADPNAYLGTTHPSILAAPPLAWLAQCEQSTLQAQCVRLLVERGANIELQDHGGHAPLMNACAEDNLSLAQALIQCGANVDARSGRHFTTLSLVLVHIEEHGGLSMLRLLLDNGASLQCPDEWPWDTYIEYLDEQFDPSDNVAAAKACLQEYHRERLAPLAIVPSDSPIVPSEVTCAICHDHIKNPCRLENCVHTFCTACVQQQWASHMAAKDKCALCRQPFSKVFVSRNE